MRRRIFLPIILFLAVILTGTGLCGDEQLNNPQPLADDVVLPMPNGRTMVLRPVCFGEGGGFYAWKRFRVGDPAGGYRELPTGVALGGAFRVESSPLSSGADWCYYIGKYEVSEDQMFAVMSSPPEYEDSAYPVRNLSWFEADTFIQQYNQWLFDNARADIPEYGGIPGYLRLPTEFEWEFAARGGSAVDGAQFDRRTPYPEGNLAEYEWFSGPRSSHNRVKQIGLLKPNVLGIHDMLGNVAEMTRSLYQVEYYQGRSGGFVAKGGHYLSDGGQLRSAMRTEQEFYALDSRSGTLSPGKKQTLGFRVVLSSLVFPNREVSGRMSDEWEGYRQGLAQSLPAAVSTSPTSTRTQVSGTEAAVHLQRLREELARSGEISQAVQQEIDLLTASLDDIQFTIRQAENDSAYAWIKIGAEQAFFLHKEARKLPILEQLLQSARSAQRTEIVARYQERESEIRQNIEQAMTSYSESIRQLGTVAPEAVENGFVRYQQFLTDRQAEQQLHLLTTVQRHANAYMSLKRIDHENWRKELLEWDGH
ncbi:formylglycine-generating enzyme family protein [Desulfobulbus alkaliphilus]|uniref:formylglycine-generating enzyme family protein n=1 Tax=Desulfobulbus alkaliphilus TaxID=869814 RepID=UPI001965A6FE|nr:SUMF1/EgtB/PvdO family nonheme iron enzyme [Desulfobulbus alkaliphilus]MBM9536208.1 SUMF1/EgtB/PvdO family nonheme iron enzyme [Desulfobulbus alkaliphilus]